MGDNCARRYSIQDCLAHEDIETIADCNARNFYELKRDLVLKRKSLCSIEQIAEDIGDPVSEVAEFEQYYSDPTVSQLQEYALAVMCVINIKATDFHPDSSSMYSQMTVPVDASGIVGITPSDKSRDVSIKEREVVE